MNDTAYLPVSLKHLEFLQALLDAASAREADPDAEVFQLLDSVRKTRGEAVKSRHREGLSCKHIADKTLSAVFSQVEGAVKDCPHSLEVLADYQQDAAAGLLTVDRLRGFLQGLSASGALPYVDYCEVDAKLEVEHG